MNIFDGVFQKGYIEQIIKVYEVLLDITKDSKEQMLKNQSKIVDLVAGVDNKLLLLIITQQQEQFLKSITDMDKQIKDLENQLEHYKGML